MTIKYLVLVGIIFVLTFAFSSHQASAAFQEWYGTVTIGANTSTNGAVVTAHVNGSAGYAALTFVGNYSNLNSFYNNKYNLVVDGGIGANVTFKVFDLNATHSFITQDTLNYPNRSELNLSVTQLADNAVCTYAQSCASGKCTSGTCASNTTAGGGSGGGGGGGGGGVAASDVEKKTEAETISIAPGGSTTARFDTLDGLEITLSTLSKSPAAYDVVITATTQDSRPSDADSDPAGVIYKYLDLKAQNIDTNQISTTVIKFNVPKLWIIENKIGLNTVSLARYESGAWNRLETKIISRGTESYSFEAVSPGLSVFAIIGEVDLTGAPVISELCGNGAIDAGEDCDGGNLGGQTCASLGLGEGALSCSEFCTFQKSRCGTKGVIIITNEAPDYARITGLLIGGLGSIVLAAVINIFGGYYIYYTIKKRK